MPELSIPILMYHRIGERRRDSLVKDQYVPLELFERQLAALAKAGFETIALDELGERLLKPSGKRPIVITFDDGYESFATSAVPAMKARGMKATVFLVANCVGKTNRWDEAKGDASEPLMNWDQVRAAKSEGMEIGAHSLNHPDLRFCDDDLLAREVAGCKEKIEEEINAGIRWFCYPYGAHRERERRYVQAAGYAGAAGTAKLANTSKTDPFALGRVNVRGTTSPGYLMRKIREACSRDG